MSPNQNRTTKSKRIQVIGLGAIIIGSCLLWQLFLMKEIYMEKERYRIYNDNYGYDRNNNAKTQEDINNNANINSLRSDEIEVAHTDKNKRRGREEQAIEKAKASTPAKSEKPKSLLDLALIRNTLLREAPWAESHGANHLSFLGAGMLYYSMAYSFRSKTIVVLGSGGGFVPRILKQAQRDLLASGVRPERREKKNPSGSVNSLPTYELYLVDAHLASAGWGSTFYAENENTTMRKEFSDIHYVFQLTDDAYANYFRPMYDDPNSKFTIDYLHVDADHGFEQSWKDFDNYSQLLSERAVISFHDTCYDNVTRNCHAAGVPETIEKLRNESHKRGLQVIDLHYLYRGIAFAFREHAPALETPRDRRINFCVNNADLIHVASDGFTKNGRVGSLPTLGDFMDCAKFNETELMLAKSKVSSSTNGIMAIPCPIKGFRRNFLSGKCDKCFPGLVGDNCQRSKYAAVQESRSGVGFFADDGDENGVSHDHDILQLVGSWLQLLSFKSDSSSDNPQYFRPISMMEVGPNAWKVPKLENVGLQSSSSPLLFGSMMTSSLSSNSSPKFVENDRFGNMDIVIVDPVLVTHPLWIDPVVSSRYRFLPCTLKDAIEYDDTSKASLLDIDIVDTLICLSCDDLVTMSSFSTTRKFLDSTFPSLTTIIFGFDANERSNEFVNALVTNEITTGEGLQSGKKESGNKTTAQIQWRLNKDLTMSMDGGSHRLDGTKKRLVLMTRTNN